MSFFCSKKNLSNSHFQLATEAYTSAVWKLKVGRDKQMKCPSWLGESILCDVSLPTTCCILHNDIMCIYIYIYHTYDSYDTYVLYMFYTHTTCGIFHYQHIIDVQRNAWCRCKAMMSRPGLCGSGRSHAATWPSKGSQGWCG